MSTVKSKRVDPWGEATALRYVLGSLVVLIAATDSIRKWVLLNRKLRSDADATLVFDLVGRSVLSPMLVIVGFAILSGRSRWRSFSLGIFTATYIAFLTSKQLFDK